MPAVVAPRKPVPRQAVRPVPIEALRQDDPAHLVAMLTDLYSRQLCDLPGDPYLRLHARPEVVQTQVSVARWYLPHLPQEGCLLDWGCRHAPDACLIRTALGTKVDLFGCDIEDAEHYGEFHRHADLNFRQLGHIYRLPYGDEEFDAVIGSGTLEHVAMDYESLKELHRVLRPGGKLILTYLPNRLSYEEWWRRNVWHAGAHPRLYSLRELRNQLLHTGFRPIEIGYQTRHDRLGSVAPPPLLKRTLIRSVGLHRVTSTLCTVAEKVTSLI